MRDTSAITFLVIASMVGCADPRGRVDLTDGDEYTETEDGSGGGGEGCIEGCGDGSGGDTGGGGGDGGTPDGGGSDGGTPDGGGSDGGTPDGGGSDDGGGTPDDCEHTGGCTGSGSGDTPPPPPPIGDGYDFGGQCTFTQGFWKTHAEAWSGASLQLGTVTYDQAQLLSILGTEITGNGLLTLAHQLIAAKLNIAVGAPTLTIAATIADADAVIGGLVVPPVGTDSLTTDATTDLVKTLDAFNRSKLAGDECD